MKEITTIDTENKYEENPRIITKKKFGLLKDHIEELGDLSGVVYCHKQKAFVGGNQRSEIFSGSDIEIVERYDKPTKTKTVAHGFVIYNGEKYSYREVRFTKKQFDKACLVANNDGGSFDWDMIANNYDEPELEEWGISTWGSTDTEVSKKAKSLLIKFNPEDIDHARELVEHFKSSEIYVGGEILDKLREIKNNE